MLTFVFTLDERIKTTSKLIVNINVDLDYVSQSMLLIFMINVDVVLILSFMAKT